MTELSLLAAFAVAAAAAWAAVGAILPWLRARAIVDRPNARSSHTVPTPRGGGLAVMAVLLPLMAALLAFENALGWRAALFLGAAILLAAVSWLDDRRPLGAAPRLLAQAIAVAAGLYALALLPLAEKLGLPPWLFLVLAALGWMWFVNLYNFMDGIDGIAGVETATIGLGLVAVAWPMPQLVPAAIAGAAAGFLIWNWHPARLFLGDVGSVPLGYLLGGLLLIQAADGPIAAALILPLYYVADATLTLARRALRGEKPWRAHREHFYQRAVQGGLSHAQVSRRVAACNLVLIALAVAAKRPGWSWPCLGAALVVVALTLAYFAGRRR